MARRTISTAVDTDGELYEDFEAFEERYETRAEAVRAALRAGIDAKAEDEQDEDDAEPEEIEHPSTLVGWSLLGLGFLTAAATSTPVLAFLLAGVVLWSLGGASLAYPALAICGGWLFGRRAVPILLRKLGDEAEAGARAWHRGAD